MANNTILQKNSEIIRTFLGRRTKDNCDLQMVFSESLRIAKLAMIERPRDGAGRYVYEVHALEVDCIVKGRAHRLCNFGAKISMATRSGNTREGRSTCPSKFCLTILTTSVRWRRCFRNLKMSWAKP